MPITIFPEPGRHLQIAYYLTNSPELKEKQQILIFEKLELMNV